MNQLSLKKFTQFAMIFAALYLAVKYFSDIIKLGGVVWSAASPLVWGCVIAYVLNILMKKIESLYFPHSTSVLVQKSRRLVSLLVAGNFWINTTTADMTAGKRKVTFFTLISSLLGMI